MSCYNNSLYFYTLLYCRFSTYGLVVSDHLVVILGTRNTRFAGFLGAFDLSLVTYLSYVIIQVQNGNGVLNRLSSSMS